MNSTNIMLLAAVITITGQWAQGKDLTGRIAIGAVFAAMGLAAVNNVDSNLGKDLALLVLTTTTLVNGPALFKAIGKAT